MLYKVGAFPLDYKIIHIIWLCLCNALFLTHIEAILANSIPNELQNGTNLDKIQAPMASIPETILSLDTLRSGLTDLLEDFRIATDENQSSIDPLAESNTPLTLNDIRNIEHNGDNPLDPSRIDSEERAPDQIPSELPPIQTSDAKTSSNHISGRRVSNEVCGMNSFMMRLLTI